MGRAMLIIVAGVLISVGIVNSSLQERIRHIYGYNSDFAEATIASNIAHSALELTIHSMMTGEVDCDTTLTPLDYSLQSGLASVRFLQCPDPDNDEVLLYRLEAVGNVEGQEKRVIVSYEGQELHFVPAFDGAIMIASEPFEFEISGAAAEINGNDPTPAGECGDKPGITYPDASNAEKVTPYDSQIYGDPPHTADPEISFDEAAELIQRLEGQPGTINLNGNINNPLGSAENPGVFFVDGSVRLGGGASEGWGILIIKSTGEMDMEDPELDLGGNFTFNGLVIFENATSLSAKGTPSIHGSMLIGKTNDSVGSMDIDIAGNVTVQYDCTMEQYAQQAAANVHQAGMSYSVLSVFE